MKKQNKKEIGSFIDYFKTENVKDNVPEPFNNCRNEAVCKLCGYRFRYRVCGERPRNQAPMLDDWDGEGMAKRHILAAHIYGDKITKK